MIKIEIISKKLERKKSKMTQKTTRENQTSGVAASESGPEQNFWANEARQNCR